jgi:parallel beta-helix repeat protein
MQGTGSGIAIAVYGRKDITVKNARIIDFGTGIELRATAFESNSTATNNRIIDNYFETKYWGINLNTNKGVVSGNKVVAKNSIYGVNFQSNNTVFSNNAFVDGGLVLFLPCFGNDFFGNTINGKPIAYMEHQANQVIDGAGQVFLSDCQNMTVRNVETTLNLRMTIELFRTHNTTVAKSKGNVILRDSHSNTLVDNQLINSGSSATYGSSAVALMGSHNNTIANNLVEAKDSIGISLAGSSYNKVYRNNLSSTGQAGVSIESTSDYQSAPEFNYVYDNLISYAENGLSLRTGARDNFVYRNAFTDCQNAIYLFSGYENTFLGNNISGSTQYAVYFYISDNNNFFHNNFWNNSKPAYENHETRIWPGANETYYSENNTWDNGKEGNYWDDYMGSDTNGDGIGETPYNVYEGFYDRYPLTAPFVTDNVTVDFARWVPSSYSEETHPLEELQIVVLSPENTTYSMASVPLNLTVSGPVSWLGYSLDFQPNVTLTGNTTLTGLSPGTHSVTVYGNATQGVAEVSETVFFTLSATESVPTATTAAVAAASVGTAAAAAYLVYWKKRKR